MKCILIFMLLVLSLKIVGQSSGYKKDSLQIKVYTEIEYAGLRAKSIKVTKVFCDYCNEAQIDLLKKLAWNQSYRERNENRYRARNGKAKLALFIRVEKEQFRRIRENE